LSIFVSKTKLFCCVLCYITRTNGGTQNENEIKITAMKTNENAVRKRTRWSVVRSPATAGLSVLELGPMYATVDRQTDVRQKHPLMPWGRIEAQEMMWIITRQNGMTTYSSADSSSDSSDTWVPRVTEQNSDRRKRLETSELKSILLDNDHQPINVTCWQWQ